MVSKWLWGREDGEGGAGGRVAALYGAQFLAIGLMVPLLPLWLAARGMDAVMIGRVLAAQSLVRVVASPLMGQVADRWGNLRAVMLASAGISWLVLAWMALLAESVWQIAFGVVASAFFFAPLVPLVETLAVRAAARLGVAYGRLRLWGSITFILGAMLAGVAMDILPAAMLIWAMVAAQGLVMLAVLAAPAEPGGQQQAAGEGGWRELLGGPFVLFIIVAGLVQASHAMLYGFSALHWQRIGHSGMVIGLLVATGVVAEIMLFWFSRAVLARLGAVRLLMLGAAAGVVRWLGLAVDPPLLALFALQALHGLTFGAAHLGAITYIHTRMPERVAATGQSIHAGVTMGLFMTPAMAFSGWLYAQVGARAWLAMAAMCALALGLAVVLRRISPRGQEAAGA